MGLKMPSGEGESRWGTRLWVGGITVYRGKVGKGLADKLVNCNTAIKKILGPSQQ